MLVQLVHLQNVFFSASQKMTMNQVNSRCTCLPEHSVYIQRMLTVHALKGSPYYFVFEEWSN